MERAPWGLPGSWSWARREPWRFRFPRSFARRCGRGVGTSAVQVNAVRVLRSARCRPRPAWRRTSAGASAHRRVLVPPHPSRGSHMGSLSLRQRPSRDCHPSAGPAIRGTASGYTRRPRLARGITRLEHAKSPGGVPEPCSGARTRWCSGDRFTNSDQLGGACGLAGLVAVSDPSMGRLFYPSPYYAVAALNLTTSSAGTRPRSFTSMPWALAHSRTSVAFSPVAEVLRPLRAGRRAPPLTRRAAPT